MSPWARALQNRTKMSPKGEEELGEPIPKHISLENKKKSTQLEELSKGTAAKKDNVYPYLGAALGVGLVMALCVVIGIYMYRKKHK